MAGLFVVPALLVPSGAVTAAQESVQDIPGAVTALDQATLDAITEARQAAAEWLPVVSAQGTNPPSDTLLASVGAAAFTLDDGGFDLERLEVLKGPQGMLFGNDRTVLDNPPSPDFYAPNTAATVVIGELVGWPPPDQEELFELALAMTWSGDEVLDESPYPGDSLLGFGNVSSYGWIGGDPFVNYAKIQGGVWTHYSDPLLRFATTTDDDRYFVGWVVPGIPEAMSLAISYSPDASIESMIAQRVDVPIPVDIPSYPLTSDFGALDPELQTSLSTLFASRDAEQPLDGEEPPPATADSGAGTGASPTGDTAGAVSDETDTADDPATASSPGTGSGNDQGGLGIVYFLAIPILGALAWFIYRWLFAKPKRPTPNAERNWVVEVADRHVRAGNPATEDGWFAPTFAEIAKPGESPGPQPGSWSGIFMNSLRFEMAGMDDPRYGELLERFGFAPPAEYSPVIEMAEEVGLGSDRGEEPTGPSADTPPPGEQPVFRTHEGPSQLMTASEEALGLADAMVGVVVDGWHLLPWGVGSEFFIREGQSHAYRTISISTMDVVTDVVFLGEPAGFEADAGRFAYWMNDDGVLKVGSPTDPHAFPMDSDPPPLESLLPMPGPGETLSGIIVERVARAHELTGGAHPVDGWIAPSNQARTVGMLSDDSGRSDYDPVAWSGHFLNIETREWLSPGQLGYDDMMRRLGVQSPLNPIEPIESSEPIDIDDTPGTN